MTAIPFDRLMDQVDAGEPLTAEQIAAVAAAHDVLSLGMLADAMRRRLHGKTVTYLRVAECPSEASFADAVPPAAREIRMSGAPESLDTAIAAVRSAKAVAGDRTVAGFSWSVVEQLASRADLGAPRVLADLRSAGLDALAELPIDATENLDAAVEALTRAGFERLRLTIRTAPGEARAPLMLRAAALQDKWASVGVINPLPTVLNAFRPTTGYDDVRAVAVARLAAPTIPTVQVDWLRYGPKLAQVALTFGADDLDGVTSSDEEPDGRRRAPLEEVRRSIESAGYDPAERDGRFRVVS